MSDEKIVPSIDPRVRRTHLLLGQALERLLLAKEFDKISVRDITDAATLNRATFYAHYPDKFALLECMVAARFTDLLEARGIRFDGGCESALRGMILGVCDYVAHTPRRESQMEPHTEAAVISVVTRMILAGMEQHAPPQAVSASMLASMLSWAIFGAVKDWVRTPERCPSEVMADQTLTLLDPLFRAAYQDVAA